MKKIFLTLIALCLPFSLWAETGTTVDADSMVTQMKSILDQYASRIKTLERENAVLRNEVMKAGIKIPLSAYTETVIQTGTTVTPSSSWTTSGTPVTIAKPTTVDSATLASLQSTYGARYAGFVNKIHTDWAGIQWAYKLPATSYIYSYEFVKQWADNHVFVDIMYTPRTSTGLFDAKILYEYNTGTFQRKLVGFFEFNPKTGFYTTKTGNNPFPWITRTFVPDPWGKLVSWEGASGTGSWVTNPPATTPPSSTATMADIEKAYGDKRYLSVISLSNNFLLANPPTYDLLRIRYRTYFIIGKYTESLAEIDKIESMWKLSSVACDAQVIATYSKNQTLVDKYTKVCKAK